MIKIPYGISGFEAIREEGFEYIDKTRFIRKIEKERYCMYVRPRRFGKTLFTTTLDAYYSLDKKDKFEKLFKGLDIYDNPTVNKNNYYVMNFNFSGMLVDNSMDLQEIENAFNDLVKTYLQQFVARYRLDIVIDDTNSAAQMLRNCLSKFQGLHLENNIYIIIDEYDHFTNGLLEGKCEKFLNILGKAGFVRAFYEVIKAYTDYNVVERFFATGVAPLTLDSMTSGFNITTSLTLNPMYVDMTGLTEEEVRATVNRAEPNDVEMREQIYKDLRENYDGYKFSKSNLKHIFNPTLVMYYLNNYTKLGTKPDDIIDKNLSTNAEKLKNLIEMVNRQQNYEIVEKLLTDGEIEGSIIQGFELDKKFGREDFISLLLYNGYITIKGTDELATNLVSFNVPNHVSFKLYAEYMMNLVDEDKKYTLNGNEFEMAILEFARKANFEKVMEYVRDFLMYSSVRDKETFNETNLKHIIHWLFVYSKVYSVYTEYPCLQGFSDMFIKSNSPKYDVYQALVELKYFNKKVGTEAKVENAKKEAREQLQKYLQDERINCEKKLKAYSVVFVGFEKFYIEEIQ